MASHLETELVVLRIIIKIGGLAENQVAEAVKAVLFRACFGKQGSKKTEIRLINSMLKLMISARVFLLQQPGFYDLSSLQCKLVGR
jgi:phosphate transport system protein